MYFHRKTIRVLNRPGGPGQQALERAAGEPGAEQLAAMGAARERHRAHADGAGVPLLRPTGDLFSPTQYRYRKRGTK
jgi:hypothetical protein